MIYGIGTDICDVRRIAATFERQGERFARKVLSDGEFKVWQARSTRWPKRGLSFLATRFSAKEAFSKAIGMGMRMPMSWRLCEIALSSSQTHRVCQAIAWLNRHYQEPLRIEDLAREVNLSTSTLHHRFKEVTALSPLQYQKQLRLQEARRLMLAEGLEASAAGYRVGYESPSQFSREYSRLFGAPPLRDLARLRQSV